MTDAATEVTTERPPAIRKSECSTYTTVVTVTVNDHKIKENITNWFR